MHCCEPERLCRSANVEDLEWWRWIPCGCKRERRAGLADYAISSGDDRRDTQNRLHERQRHDGRVHVQDESMSRANSATRRTRVLIVDDHPMTRAGLVHVIIHKPDMGAAKPKMPPRRSLPWTRKNPIWCSPTSRFPARAGWSLSRTLKRCIPGLPHLLFRF